MSADNGIYIAKFPDGYRVTYAMCIDNIDYFPVGSKKRKKELGRYFGKSPVFAKRKRAWKYASKLYDEMDMLGVFILEYGICYIGEYEAFE